MASAWAPRHAPDPKPWLQTVWAGQAVGALGGLLVIFSRRNICSKVRRTLVVPEPEEPVTEMMGCLADI